MNNYHDRQSGMTTRTTVALLIQPGSIIASAGGWVGEETWRAGAKHNAGVKGNPSWAVVEVEVGVCTHEYGEGGGGGPDGRAARSLCASS